MRINGNSFDLVSVVIPCYNSGQTVTQAVTSVKSQTWPNIEVLIVDDGSTDEETLRVLSQIEGVCLVRQRNLGLPAARNTGFRHALGKYVLPLDADDWIEPDTIECLVKSLQDNSGVSFAYSYLQLEGQAHGVLVKKFNFFEQLFVNQVPYSLLLPKNLWLEIGGYDETMCRGYEDWDFNIRLGLYGYYGVVVPRPLVHYRVSSSGMLISRSNRLHGELWSEIQEKYRFAYKPSSLLGFWRQWKEQPSNYPLLLYVFWFAFHKLVPKFFFTFIFLRLRNYSQSRRVSTRNGRV